MVQNTLVGFLSDKNKVMGLAAAQNKSFSRSEKRAFRILILPYPFYILLLGLGLRFYQKVGFFVGQKSAFLCFFEEDNFLELINI